MHVAGVGPVSPGSRGFTLVELLFALGLFLVLSAMAVPAVLAGLDRSRARAAARFLSARMALARSQAVARSAAVALRFAERRWHHVVDGIRRRQWERRAVEGHRVGRRSVAGCAGQAVRPVSGRCHLVVRDRVERAPLVSRPTARPRPGRSSFADATAPSSPCGCLASPGRTRVLRYDTATRDFVETF